MDFNIYTVGIILLLIVAAGVIFYYFKKRNIEKFFSQVYEQTRQVPRQKKNSFLLLLFKESILASKNKSKQSSFANKLQNPKYLETQLVHMSRILKDSSNVKDKTIKKSLSLLKSYQQWEKARIAQSKKAA